jgi:hypothetical protein
MPARNVNWQRLVNKWTSKQWMDSWKKLDGELGTLRFTARSLPPTVAPVDWAAWKGKIRDTGAVDKLQKEYEGKQFTSDSNSFEETDKYINKMEQWYTELREFSQKKIVMLEAKLEELYEERSTIGFWNASDMFHKFPGLQEQIALRGSRSRLKNRYVPSTRIAVFDFSEARKALKEGRRPENLPPPLRSVGDFNREEWDKREKKELEWLESRYKQIMET